MDSNFRNACRGVLRRRSALALIAGAAMAVASIAGSAPAAHAQTVINVTVGNDPGTSSSGATGGPGTLSAALAQVNASTPPGGFIINLQTNVTLSGPLSPIFNSVTINGGGFTISGNNTTRIFMIGVDSATQTRGPLPARSSRSGRKSRSAMSRWRQVLPKAAPARAAAAAAWAPALRCS
jgi:hypothetical protein